jgi:galactokinase
MVYFQSNMENLRIEKLMGMAEARFGGFSPQDAFVVSAPGRMELLGNHTDHQHGFALSTAVDLDTLGLAAPNGESAVRVCSEGWPEVEVDLKDLRVREERFETPAALVAGVCAAFQREGRAVKGFDAVVTSDVLKGSGLSSSASFEVWVAAALDAVGGGAADPIALAKAGQYAENVYFGKPCGLQDQLACAIGGPVFIDFADTENPVVEKVEGAFPGHSICVIDVGADHANLTEHYAAIREDLTLLSAEFGAPYLRRVDKQAFLERVPALRGKYGDRPVLRALHIFEENDRVRQAKESLQNGDLDSYFQCVRASGFSSFMYLQNVSIAGEVARQPLAVALALAGDVLGGRGAYRIQGGGFAGTVEAFVPDDLLPAFTQRMQLVFGEGACKKLSVRNEGATAGRLHP